jgi:hypothetical protein
MLMHWLLFYERSAVLPIVVASYARRRQSVCLLIS